MIDLDREWLSDHPLPHPGGDTDKDDRGKVLAAGGSETVPGALLLTGEAALRAGAGKVQLATVDRAALALGVAMPEAAAFALPANNGGELGSTAGARLAELIERCDAMVLGPGMGPAADAAGILAGLIDHAPSEGSIVLDAAMIAVGGRFAHNHAAWPGRRVFTPHFGEMARLMACDKADVTPDLAQNAAERFGATIVLKASETWIATPGAPMLHYAGGGPGLATAGSGDVLAGLIGGLLARGLAPTAAAAWGVWLHGAAGRQLAKAIGPLGFVARELLAVVPALLPHGAGVA